MNEWFEDESFWTELYPFLFTEERFQAAEIQLDKILTLAGYKKGSILDLCCGPGTYSLANAKRDIDVTGVDRSAYLLRQANSKAKESGLTIEFIPADMRHFLRPATFGMVLSMFTSFGYFEDPQDDLRVLQNAYSNLQSGGCILLDTVGKELIAEKYAPTLSRALPDGSVLIERHDIIDGWTRMDQEWIVVRGEKAKRFKFRHRLYSGQEMKDLFMKAGFQNVQTYGDLDAKPYGLQSARLIVTGTK